MSEFGGLWQHKHTQRHHSNKNNQPDDCGWSIERRRIYAQNWAILSDENVRRDYYWLRKKKILCTMTEFPFASDHHDSFLYGKDLGKCTHRWMINNEKNTNKRFWHLVSSSGERKKTTTKRWKKQRRGQTRRRQFHSWNSFDPVWLPPLICPLLCFFLLFVVCLSPFTWRRHLVSKALVCTFFYRLSSIGQYIF